MPRQLRIAGGDQIIEQVLFFEVEMVPDLALESDGKIDEKRTRAAVGRRGRFPFRHEAFEPLQQGERRHMLVMQLLTDPV